jgi:hypothetical protein
MFALSPRSALIVSALLVGSVLTPIAPAFATEVVPPATVHVTMDDLPEAAGDDGELEQSRPVAAEVPFSLLGLTLPEGVEAAEVRTRGFDGQWSAWTELELEVAGVDGPDPATAEAAAAATNVTEPLWVGGADAFQVRLDGELTDVEATLIDTEGHSESRVAKLVRHLTPRVVASPAEASASRPTIVTRAQWGANESLRRGSPSYSTPRYTVIHHTAGSNTYTREQSAAVVRGIYSYHTQTQQWADIGYNFLVDRFGTVYEGRFGGVDRGVVGAHASGFNTGSIGVASMGDHDTVDISDAAFGSIAQVVAWKYQLHGIDPGTTRTVTANGRTLATTTAHRDVGSTACPGRLFYAKMGTLRTRIQTLSTTAAAPAPSPTPTPTPTPKPTPAPSGSVVAGSGHHPLAGTNIVRGADQLVVYTPARGTTTGANQWGAEAIVVGGKVTTLVDRSTTGAAALTIPRDGVVLSGHGTARTFLLTHAKPGTTVTIPGHTPTPAPAPTPTPKPTPAPSGSVVAGSGHHPLAGTNIVRGADQLVVYTPARGTTTGANQWGAEAIVVGGKVTTLVDRSTTGAAALTIPRDGVVLSGHGTARTFLLTHAKPGTTVTIPGHTPTPAPAPAPAPTAPRPTATQATPVTGDFNGDGRTQTGWFFDGWWFLPTGRNGATQTFAYGRRGDVPVTGDFNGDGRDGIGVYRSGQWLLRQTATAGAAQLNFSYGRASDRPVVGDFNGTGRDGIGVYRDGRWLLRQTATAGAAQLDLTYGRATDRPVVGDFNGNGRDGIGVVRSARWLLRQTATAGTASVTFDFGRATDRIVVGDFNRNLRDTPAVVRAEKWLISNHIPARPADQVITYAPTSTQPR